MIGARPRSPRSRSRSPFGRRSRSTSPFRRRDRSRTRRPPPERRWGRRILAPGFRQGYFYYGGKGYTYPLWYYNWNYWPWWYAYYSGFMSDSLYAIFSRKYGPPPPRDPNDPQKPEDLRTRESLLVLGESISCDVCGATAEEKQLHHCEGCKDAIYCGVECQRVDFEMHKEECL